jgi:hypothetical protein
MHGFPIPPRRGERKATREQTGWRGQRTCLCRRVPLSGTIWTPSETSCRAPLVATCKYHSLIQIHKTCARIFLYYVLIILIYVSVIIHEVPQECLTIDTSMIISSQLHFHLLHSMLALCCSQFITVLLGRIYIIIIKISI